MSPLLITIIGSTLAVIVGIILRKIASVRLVTNTNFRTMQVEQRRLHDEHFILKGEFDEFLHKQETSNKQHLVFLCRAEHERYVKEFRECYKELEGRIIGREAFYREFDKLEKAHNDDVAEINRTTKGGLESITKRIDDLIKSKP